jgi:hypothetical protein
MAARYEIGDPDRPRGHALLYFRVSGGDEVLATYLIVLPIAINPARYIPPAFAARMPTPAQEVDATALPPIPEAAKDLATLRRLAEHRGDDLLDGGIVEGEPERLMMVTAEVSREYAERYQAAVPGPQDEARADAADDESETDETALRWMFLDEKGRIGELAKLTGQLRYAVDGGDERLIRDTVEEMRRLQRYLPDKFRLDEFVSAASRPGDTGRRLAELYIDRCYKLSNEQYEDLGRIDQEIADLERSES